MRTVKRVVPFDNQTINNNNCFTHNGLPQHESKLNMASTAETRRRRRSSGQSPFLVFLQKQSTLVRMGLLLVVLCVSSVLAFLVQQQQEYALINSSSLDWAYMHQQLLRNEQENMTNLSLRFPRRKDARFRYERMKRDLQREQDKKNNGRNSGTRLGVQQPIYSLNNPNNTAPPNKTLGVQDFADLKYDEEPPVQTTRTTSQAAPNANGSSGLPPNTGKQQRQSNDNRDQMNHQQQQQQQQQARKKSRKPILDLLQRAGFDIDNELLNRLPSWQDVTDLYGSEPVILGMETCQGFRDAVPIEDRFVAPGGQQNVGTNALGQMMALNLEIPQNLHHAGIQRELPWNKHGWLAMRGISQIFPPFRHDIVMPIFVIRDPFFWIHSMCESPYNMEWNRNQTTTKATTNNSIKMTTSTPLRCPNLVALDRMAAATRNNNINHTHLDERMGEPVQISWSKTVSREYKSLAHAWSEWYREYLDADFPRLMVRFEDLIFHAPVVLEKIRECVGAVWKEEDFVFVTQPAKTAKYFTNIKTQSGLISAMIRYGHDPNGRRTRNMTDIDVQYAKTYFDSVLMETFHYQWPT